MANLLQPWRAVPLIGAAVVIQFPRLAMLREVKLSDVSRPRWRSACPRAIFRIRHTRDGGFFRSRRASLGWPRGAHEPKDGGAPLSFASQYDPERQFVSRCSPRLLFGSPCGVGRQTTLVVSLKVVMPRGVRLNLTPLLFSAEVPSLKSSTANWGVVLAHPRVRGESGQR
jgi:hypothetical protein